MESKKLYVISKQEKSSLHLYFLPGQTLKDGSEVDCTLRIQCRDRVYRDSKPNFSLFELDSENVTLSEKKSFYCGSKSELKYLISLGNMIENADFKICYKNWEISDFGNKDNSEFSIISTEGKLKVFYQKSNIPETRPRPVFATIDLTDSEKTSTTEEVKEEKPKSWMEETFSSSTLRTPSSTKDGFYMTKKDWQLLIRNIKRHVNTLITGPAGTGKTSCVKLAADRLGLPLYTFDMGAMVDPISSLLGVHRLQDGHSVFDYAQFTKVIQEPCIILLDELSRAPIGVGNVLFPCLDDRRILPIEIAGGDDKRSISIHPEVTFIATANIGAEYTGTTTIDKALVNRFFPLELGYLPAIEEKKVLVKRTGISEETSELIVKVANTIRTMNKKMELSSAVSIRETIMISSLVSDGWSLGDAMKAVYIPMYSGDSTDGERSKIIKTLASF